MLQLMAYAAVGILLHKTGILRQKMLPYISKLLVSVLLPLLLFIALYDSFKVDYFFSSLSFLVLLLAGMAICFVLCYASGKKLGLRCPQLGALVFSCFFYNSGFLTMPLVQALFDGPQSVFNDKIAVLYSSIAVILVNLLMGSFGSVLMQAFTGGGTRLKTGHIFAKIVLNPAVICFALGLVFSIGGIVLPSGINTLLHGVGRLTAPFAMVLLGSMLAQLQLKNIFGSKSLYLLSAVRLLAAPVLAWLLARVFTGNATLSLTIAICIGTPVATAMPAFAMQSGGDTQWSSNYTFLSTLLSALTLPLLVAAIAFFQ